MICNLGDPMSLRHPVSCVHRACFVSYTCIYQNKNHSKPVETWGIYDVYEVLFFPCTLDIPASVHATSFVRWCEICRVLQRVAVCCSVLQCPAVCCSVLQYVALCDGIEAWCICDVWWHPPNSAPPSFCFCLLISFFFLACDEYIKKLLLHVR